MSPAIFLLLQAAVITLVWVAAPAAVLPSLIVGALVVHVIAAYLEVRWEGRRFGPYVYTSRGAIPTWIILNGMIGTVMVIILGL